MNKYITAVGSAFLSLCLCGCSVAGGLLEAAGDLLDGIELSEWERMQNFTRYDDCPARDYFSEEGMIKVVHDELCDISDHDITPERLASLTELNIGFAESLDGIEHLTGLESLTIYYEGVGVTLRKLEALENLRELDMKFQNKTIQSDLETLAAHTGLTRLALDFYQSGQVAPPLDFVAELSALDELSLGFYNERPHLDALSGLHLNLLEIEHAYIGPDFLPHTADISELWLSNCVVEDLSALTALEALGSLMLFRSDLEDLSALPGIPGLWELYVERCDFDRADLLADIPALTSLSLRQAGLTSIDFAASLTGLTYLDLHWNEISDLTPLAGLTGLEHLNLVTNDIQDVSPLAELTSLTYLALDGNPVEDAGPLSDMINLRRLGLGGTLVWDLAPLAGLTDLTSLDISGEYYDKLEYGEVDLAPLAGLLKLTHLNLEYNIISDFTPLAGLADILGEEAFKECIGYPTIIALIEDITLTDNRIVPILTCKIPIAPNGTAVTLEKYNYVSRLEVLDEGILQFHSTLTPVTEEVSSMFGYTTEDMLFNGILIVRATEEELPYIQAGQS